ncbi:putative vacuolar membrane protein [Papiliotrema laurentii]|uniref:Vacuolar membrane protein n=1 Tax=Papiliotrema laurentii TaxID=5418 RepID=A0AAD9L8V3_PAPLA|nr:putative vacuolar membrane protein [Papiliotrema laurentii]
METPMSKLRLAWTAIWAATHVTQYGMAITSLNGIQDAVTCNLDAGVSGRRGRLSPCIDMPVSHFGLVVSIFTIGGLVGSLASDTVTRRLGRLGTFRLSAQLILIGAALVGLSNTVVQMLIGRVSVGLGCGLASVSVPLFLGEIAPANIKKALGIANQLFIVVGMLVGQSLSFPFAQYGRWRWVFAFSVGLALCQLLGSLWIVVPRAEKQIAEVADAESAPLLDPHQREGRLLSIKDLFTSQDPVIRRGLIVVIVTQLAQQLCGISPVMYFSTRILKPVFNGNSRMIALSIVIFKLPLTALPAIVIERSGTRPILLFSSFAMIIWALFLAYGLNADSGPMAAVGMVSFVAFFSFGLGPVAWVVLSEVMPREATTAAGALGIALNWSMNFVMGSTFLPLQQALSRGKPSGEGNIFYLLAGNCALAFLAIKASYKAYDAVKP